MGQTEQKQSWWNNGQNRALVFQVVLTLAVVLFFWYIINNTLLNMEKRGIATGFGFLSQAAGFGIIQHLVAYDETYSFGRTFLVGLLNTLLVAVIGIVFATIIGLVVGVARLSSNWLISTLAAVYIEVFRNIPLLLQIFFWYFAVLRGLPLPRGSWEVNESFFMNIRGLYIPRPIFESGFSWVIWAVVLAFVVAFVIRRWARRRQAETGQQFNSTLAGLGVILILPLTVFFAVGSPLSWEVPVLKGFNFKGGMVVIPELTALVVALSIYTGAFIAEIVRSGILAVSHGQTEAALSLGLRPRRVLSLVVIPQALRVIIPQQTSQYLNLVKNSSLATAIGYPDLVSVFAGTTLNQTGQAMEVIAMTMGVYLFISLTISALMNWYNKKKMLIER